MSNNPTSFQKQLGFFATAFRILLAPTMLIGLYIPQEPNLKYVCATLFIIASLTDWLDGYWARKYQGTSDFGKFLDPAADKILILGAFMTLLSLDRINVYLVFFILGRDFVIGAVRSAAAAKSLIIAAKPLGKWKTAIQMICVPILFLNEDYFGLPLIKIATVFLWLSLALSLISGAEYYILYKKGLKKV